MDPLLLTTLLQRAAVESEREKIVLEGHVNRLAYVLVEEEGELTLPALEVLFYLTLDASLRPHLVAQEGLLENVKKLQSRGRLKQKRVAIATVQNLHVRLTAPHR